MAVVTRPERRFARLTAAPRRSWDRRALGRDWQIAWLFLIPLVLVLLVLVAYPFVAGIILSMQRKVVGRRRPGSASTTFAICFSAISTEASSATRSGTTVIYTLVSVALKAVIGCLMALLLNERFRGQTLMRALLFLPWAMPTIIVALTWRWILDGASTASSTTSGSSSSGRRRWSSSWPIPASPSGRSSPSRSGRAPPSTR